MNQKRPNILLITSDQQHWNTLGFLNSEVKTPNLDRLAAQGTVFTRAYCPNPTCTPTRASIITGQYPSQHGAWSLGTKLPESAHTVGDDFDQAGYKTALVGKAHFQPLRETEEFSSLESYPIMQDMDFWREFKEPFYGFRHVELARNHVDEAHVGQHYAIWMEEKGLLNWRDYFQPPTGNNSNQVHKWLIPEEFHYDAWIAERTNALLDEYKENDESFFLWASFFDPHPPYLAPEPWDTMYDSDDLTIPEVTPAEHDANPPHFGMTQETNPDFTPWNESNTANHGMHCQLMDKKSLAKNVAVYYGMISLMDKYIGKILDKLDETGMAENTVVVFTCDHGHFFGHHGLTAKGPFHYEDMIKVPFIVRYPGIVPVGVTSDALQSLVDLAPTFLSIAGLPIPRTMTGVDQSEVWFGRKNLARDHIIVENHHEPTTIHVKTYVNERYKLTVYLNRDYGELFDLQSDQGEINNLWNKQEYSALKSELVMKLLFAEMAKEPMWMPRIWGA
ncbi:MAG: sulfatase family protein [Armatimonadota bacterium]